MKNNKKLSDALGSIDEKYIDEYVNGQSVVSRRPMIWRTVIAASVAVTLLVGAVVGIPAAFRGNTELGDGTSPNDTISETKTAAGNILLNIADTEYIVAEDGSQVLHVKNSATLPNELKNVHYMAESATPAIDIYYNWDKIIDTAINSTSSESLIFKGVQVGADTYCFDKQETVIDEGKVVEYDYASGTTAYHQYGEPQEYTVMMRYYFTVRAVKITEILKLNNNTGYNVGDTIYIYSESKFQLYDGDILIPEAGGVVTVPAYEVTEIAIEPAAPTTEPIITAAESSGARPATTTTAAPAWTPSTQSSPETIPELGIETAVAETFVGAIPEPAPEDTVTNTASYAPVEMLYIVGSANGKISDAARAKGIIDFDVWYVKNSCTAEQYETYNIPDDSSDMKFYYD